MLTGFYFRGFVKCPSTAKTERQIPGVSNMESWKLSPAEHLALAQIANAISCCLINVKLSRPSRNNLRSRHCTSDLSPMARTSRDCAVLGSMLRCCGELKRCTQAASLMTPQIWGDACKSQGHNLTTISRSLWRLPAAKLSRHKSRIPVHKRRVRARLWISLVPI